MDNLKDIKYSNILEHSEGGVNMGEHYSRIKRYKVEP